MKTYTVFMAFLLGFLSSCAMKHDKPNRLYSLDLPFNEVNPDMFYSPALKAQEPGMRMPPPGTNPVNFTRLSEQVTIEDAGTKLVNPVPLNEKTMARGKHMFQNNCLVCHGPYGEGNGTVVPKYPMPPSLQSEKVRNYKDGNIFYVITMGQNIMPSYKAQITPEDRWSIIHYIRAIQRAKNPTPQDLQAKK